MFGLNWTAYGYNNPATGFRDVFAGSRNMIAFGETTSTFQLYKLNF